MFTIKNAPQGDKTGSEWLVFKKAKGGKNDNPGVNIYAPPSREAKKAKFYRQLQAERGKGNNLKKSPSGSFLRGHSQVGCGRPEGDFFKPPGNTPLNKKIKHLRMIINIKNYHNVEKIKFVLTS